MPHLEWNESLKVHVDELDRQHRGFIDMANELHDALMDGDLAKVEESRKSTLESLKRYLHEHFGDEEAHMERIGFPRLEEHRSQHRAFAAKVESFQESLSSGEAVLNSEIMKTMLNWIFAHIATEDARYRDFNRAG